MIDSERTGQDEVNASIANAAIQWAAEHERAGAPFRVVSMSFADLALYQAVRRFVPTPNPMLTRYGKE